MSSKTKEQHDLDNEVYQLVWAVSKGEQHPHGGFQRIVEILDKARNSPLLPHERRLAAELLSRASDEFSNHGCNDLKLDNTDENWALVSEMEDEPGERPALGKKIVTYDWLAMNNLAKKLAAE